MKTTAAKFLGTSDEVTSCDCCGKQNLKSTVALSINDADPVYFGVTCAARALKMGVKEVKAANKSADDAKHAAARAAANAAHSSHMVRWTTFLTAKTGISEIFNAIEALGGYAAASALFKAEGE